MDQAAGGDVFAEVQRRFVGDAAAGDGPAADGVAVVADSVAADLDASFPAVALEAPEVVQFVGDPETEAVVPNEGFGRFGNAVFFQIGGGGAEQASVVCAQGQGDQAGVVLHAVADCQIDRLAINVGGTVAELQAETDVGPAYLEIVQPAEDVIAAEVGGQRDLQVVADDLAAGGDFFGGVAQAVEGQPCGREQAFAFARQAQAAR